MAALLKIFLGLALVHFQKHWLLRNYFTSLFLAWVNHVSFAFAYSPEALTLERCLFTFQSWTDLAYIFPVKSQRFSYECYLITRQNFPVKSQWTLKKMYFYFSGMNRPCIEGATCHQDGVKNFKCECDHGQVCTKDGHASIPGSGSGVRPLVRNLYVKLVR